MARIKQGPSRGAKRKTEAPAASPPAAKRPASGGEKLMETFVCPITHHVLVDPVLAADGQSYERSAWERYVRDRAEVPSPLTRAVISSAALPNSVLRRAIEVAMERDDANLPAEDKANWHVRRADVSLTNRGDAAAAAWIFRGDEPRRRRGRDADTA